MARAQVPSIRKTVIPQSTLRPFHVNEVAVDIQVAIAEAVDYVEQNRFIVQQPNDDSLSITIGGQWLITKRGLEWANGVDPLPEDYDGYMKQFAATTDPVVCQYISEALNTFIRGTYFASAVMIGAASEKAIYLLADSLVPALKDAAKRNAMPRKIDARKLESLFKRVEEVVIDGHTTKTIPFDAMGGDNSSPSIVVRPYPAATKRRNPSDLYREKNR